MSESTNRAALARSAEAWTSGSLDGYLDIYSPSIVHHGMAREPLDHAANRAVYEVLWAAFPNSALTVEATVAEGDMLASRFTLRGTHRGEFMGIAPTHRSVVIVGQNILRFADGRNVERWTTSDIYGLLRQLGVQPGRS